MTRNVPGTSRLAGFAYLSLAAVLWIAACTTAPLPATRPPAQQIETIGIVAAAQFGDGWTRFELVDGRVWERQNDDFDLRYDSGGLGGLFVAGHDAVGPYALVIGGQDGLPESCPWVLDYGGREWGDAVEIVGLLWQKAPTFTMPRAPKPIGAAYPSSMRFCLNDEGRLTGAVHVPNVDDPAARPSATAQ